MTLAVDFDLDRLLVAIQICLNKVIEAASDLGVLLPVRRIAAAGVVPYDCEQVVVYPVQLTTGAPESIRPGHTGAGTYPNSGANMTIWTATIQIAIVRKTNEIPAGRLGTVAPEPPVYLVGLVEASKDTAVLIRALEQIAADEIVSAIPRTFTYSAPQGGMSATLVRIGLVI